MMIEWFMALATKLASFLLIFLSVYLMPLRELGLTILVLMLIDFATGIWASNYRQIAITSNRMKRSVSKFIVYGIALVVGLLITQQFGINILIIVGFYLASVEVKSIFENLHLVYPHINIYKQIKDSLSSEKSKLLDQRKEEREKLHDDQHHKNQKP